MILNYPKGDFNQSIEHFKEFHELEMQNIADGHRQDIEILLLQHELQSLSREKLEYIESEKHKRFQIQILFGLSAAVLLVFIVLIVQRLRILKEYAITEELRRKESELNKNQLEKDLKYEQKEVATKLMYLVQKNDFIVSVSEQLKDVIESIPESDNQKIHQVINSLERMKDKDAWMEFEIRFKEIYDDFYVRLLRRFPNLSPAELKMSEFLKLNMSTKEISMITFQTPDSIKTTRYRLRKKLNLDRETNLTSFLNNI